MKILGVNNNNINTSYIVEISHNEVAKVMNKSVYGDGKLEELKPNTEFDISLGYDFRGEIVRAVNSMELAHKNFAAASAVMTRFIALLPTDLESPQAATPSAQKE